MKSLLVLENGSTQNVDWYDNPFRNRGYFPEDLEKIKEEIKKSFNNNGLKNKVVRVHLYRN